MNVLEEAASLRDAVKELEVTSKRVSTFGFYSRWQERLEDLSDRLGAATWFLGLAVREEFQGAGDADIRGIDLCVRSCEELRQALGSDPDAFAEDASDLNEFHTYAGGVTSAAETWAASIWRTYCDEEFPTLSDEERRGKVVLLADGELAAKVVRLESLLDLKLPEIRGNWPKNAKEWKGALSAITSARQLKDELPLDRGKARLDAFLAGVAGSGAPLKLVQDPGVQAHLDETRGWEGYIVLKKKGK